MSIILPPGVAERIAANSPDPPADDELRELLANLVREYKDMMSILFLVLERAGGAMDIPKGSVRAERDQPRGFVRWQMQPDGGMRVWWESEE